jgi:U3 small nucleolar RNA-associated protein 19
MVHRARFFRIVEKCLSSTYVLGCLDQACPNLVHRLLPATIIASFIKRLSRLSLTAPPAAHVAIVPFTYNVLKNNPSLMVMIHRIPDNLSAFEDPFNPAEPDPQRTNALDSSLWELRGASGKHFHAAVFTMFKVLEAPFTKPSYQLEDFIDHSYSTMFETEARRRVKQDPAVVDEKVVGELFPTTKRETEATVDVVTELWSFGVEPVI